MSAPFDYDDFLDTDSSYSDCECQRRFFCKCKIEGQETLETRTTKILLGEVIGCGNFSTVRIGYDVNTGEPCAVKLVDRVEWKGPNWPNMSNQQKEYAWLKKEDDDRLIGEFKNYILVNAVERADQNRYYVGLPIVYECGFFKEYNFMTMELLGPDLLDLFILCKYRFSLKTVIQITIQLMKTLKYIHDIGVVHRDIKPDNCLIGLRSNRKDSVIYLADFANSRELYCRKRQVHIRPKIGLSLHGNARFGSLNTHLGKELSRRDDLESLCYMIVYFMKGSLPWQGLEVSNSNELWVRVAETKRITPAGVLCDGLPSEFLKFYRYVKRLTFSDNPKYDYWIKQFSDLYKIMGYSNVNGFDWTPHLSEETALLPQ